MIHNYILCRSFLPWWTKITACFKVMYILLYLNKNFNNTKQRFMHVLFILFYSFKKEREILTLDRTYMKFSIALVQVITSDRMYMLRVLFWRYGFYAPICLCAFGWVGVISPWQLVLVCSYENILGQVWGWCTIEPGLNPPWQIVLPLTVPTR
jgi:hypothetical protein